MVWINSNFYIKRSYIYTFEVWSRTHTRILLWIIHCNMYFTKLTNSWDYYSPPGIGNGSRASIHAVLHGAGSPRWCQYHLRIFRRDYCPLHPAHWMSACVKHLACNIIGRCGSLICSCVCICTFYIIMTLKLPSSASHMEVHVVSSSNLMTPAALKSFHFFLVETAS